jgi:hypothetical protein
MKNTLNVIFLILIGAAFGIAVYGSYLSHTRSYHMTTENPEPVIEYVYIEKDPQIVTEYVYIPTEEVTIPNLTFEEQELLEQIAYAEAKGEGVRGMMLVMNVVLNRAERNGMSIYDVIYSPGQFYTEGMTPDVSDECHQALALVMDGEDGSLGALYFNAGGYRNGKEPLFQYKNHYFSK